MSKPYTNQFPTLKMSMTLALMQWSMVSWSICKIVFTLSPYYFFHSKLNTRGIRKGRRSHLATILSRLLIWIAFSPYWIYNHTTTLSEKLQRLL